MLTICGPGEEILFNAPGRVIGRGARLSRPVMNRDNPRVGNVERLRDSGRIGGTRAATGASEGSF